MIWRQAKAILILPVNVLIVIPSLLVYATNDTQFAAAVPDPGDPTVWVAIFPLLTGGWLGGWSMILFWKFANGTPAPWDPPQSLIIRGPYRHVRNPMISGVVFVLIAESLIFRSPAIGAWATLFFIGNSIYFPLVEEKGLEKRFGESYVRYKSNVPRWLPCVRPWGGDGH